MNFIKKIITRGTKSESDSDSDSEKSENYKYHLKVFEDVTKSSSSSSGIVDNDDETYHSASEADKSDILHRGESDSESGENSLEGIEVNSSAENGSTDMELELRGNDDEESSSLVELEEGEEEEGLVELEEEEEEEEEEEKNSKTKQVRPRLRYVDSSESETGPIHSYDEVTEEIDKCIETISSSPGSSTASAVSTAGTTNYVMTHSPTEVTVASTSTSRMMDLVSIEEAEDQASRNKPPGNFKRKISEVEPELVTNADIRFTGGSNRPFKSNFDVSSEYDVVKKHSKSMPSKKSPVTPHVQVKSTAGHGVSPENRINKGNTPRKSLVSAVLEATKTELEDKKKEQQKVIYTSRKSLLKVTQPNESAIKSRTKLENFTHVSSPSVAVKHELNDNNTPTFTSHRDNSKTKSSSLAPQTASTQFKNDPKHHPEPAAAIKDHLSISTSRAVNTISRSADQQSVNTSPRLPGQVVVSTTPRSSGQVVVSTTPRSSGKVVVKTTPRSPGQVVVSTTPRSSGQVVTKTTPRSPGQVIVSTTPRSPGQVVTKTTPRSPGQLVLNTYPEDLSKHKTTEENNRRQNLSSNIIHKKMALTDVNKRDITVVSPSTNLPYLVSHSTERPGDVNEIKSEANEATRYSTGQPRSEYSLHNFTSAFPEAVTSSPVNQTSDKLHQTHMVSTLVSTASQTYPQSAMQTASSTYEPMETNEEPYFPPVVTSVAVTHSLNLPAGSTETGTSAAEVDLNSFRTSILRQQKELGLHDLAHSVLPPRGNVQSTQATTEKNSIRGANYQALTTPATSSVTVSMPSLSETRYQNPVNQSTQPAWSSLDYEQNNSTREINSFVNSQKQNVETIRNPFYSGTSNSDKEPNIISLKNKLKNEVNIGKIGGKPSVSCEQPVTSPQSTTIYSPFTSPARNQHEMFPVSQTPGQNKGTASIPHNDQSSVQQSQAGIYPASRTPSTPRAAPENISSTATASSSLQNNRPSPSVQERFRGIPVSAVQIKTEPTRPKTPPAEVNPLANKGDKYSFEVADRLKIHICYDDLVAQTVDAVVNPTDGQLTHVNRASLAIAAAAGDDMIRECKDFLERNAGPLEKGQVFDTQASGTLRGKVSRILHVSTPVWSLVDETQSCYDLLKTYLNCLVYASDELKLKSIAFPLIGSDSEHPMDACISAFFKALLVFVFEKRPQSRLTNVHLVINDFYLARFCLQMVQDYLEQILLEGIDGAMAEAVNIFYGGSQWERQQNHLNESRMASEVEEDTVPKALFRGSAIKRPRL